MKKGKSYSRGYDMPPGNALSDSYGVLTECILEGTPVALVPIPSDHETFKKHGVFALPADAEYGFHASDAYAQDIGKLFTNKEEEIPGLIAIRVAVQATEQAEEMADDAANGMFDIEFDDDDVDEDKAVEWTEGYMAGRALAGDPSEVWLEGWNAGVDSAEQDVDEDE